MTKNKNAIGRFIFYCIGTAAWSYVMTITLEANIWFSFCLSAFMTIVCFLAASMWLERIIQNFGERIRGMKNGNNK